jgi:cytochrome c
MAMPAGIPSFRGIANKTGQTGKHIEDVLIKPHQPMPDMQLSRDEIQNIISYLETLRTDKSAPPLLPPEEQDTKPLYPEPT